MDRLWNKYEFSEEAPICKPYKEKETYNAYYKGMNQENGLDVLISEYRQGKYEQLVVRSKRLQKLKQVQHRNLAKIYDVFLDSEQKRLFVVLQWCEGGSLYDYHLNQHTFDHLLATQMVRDTCLALNAIHEADLIHRFINLQNIMFDGDGVLKLTIKCLYYKSYYLSPEEKQGQKLKQNDIFSLGVVLHKLLLNSSPFKGNSIDQYIQSVIQGIKYPKRQQEMFPICIPAEVKELMGEMTEAKAGNRIKGNEVVKCCSNLLGKTSELTLFSSGLKRRIFRFKYIPLFIKLHNEEQTQIIALNKDKNQLSRITVFKGKNKELKTYTKEQLEDFKKVNQFVGIMPIQESKIIENQYLMIATIYEQGSLKEYFDNGGKISLEHARNFTNSLRTQLKKFNHIHGYLTYDCIVLRRGNFYVKYPPFMTKNHENQIKNSRGKAEMIAPEVIEGIKSQKCDSWSLAMMKFKLQHGVDPEFDKNDKVIIPKKAKMKKEDVDFYHNFLVKDYQKRKNILDEEKDEMQAIPEISLVKKSKKEKDIRKKEQVKKTWAERFNQFFNFLVPVDIHWSKPIRILLKSLFGIVLYLFLFYFALFSINGALLAEHSIYEATTIEIRALDTDSTPNINYTLVTKTPESTHTLFENSTLSVLRDEYRCVLNDYSVESDIESILNLSGFTAFQVFGILLPIINLILYLLVLGKLDFPKMLMASNFEEGNYHAIWNWLFVNLAIVTQAACIYLIYGGLFHIILEPCLEKAPCAGLQYLWKDWVFSFNIRFIWIYLGLIFTYIIIIFFLIRPKQPLHGAIKITLLLLYMAGVGARVMGGSSNKYISSKQSIFGKCPQLLLIMTGLIFLFIDSIFSICLQQRSKPGSQKSGQNGNMEQSLYQINHTEQALS